MKTKTIRRPLALLTALLMALTLMLVRVGAIDDLGRGQDTCYYGVSYDGKTLYQGGQKTENCKYTFDIYAAVRQPWDSSHMLEKVVFDDKLYPKSTKYWFHFCGSLKTIWR